MIEIKPKKPRYPDVKTAVKIAVVNAESAPPPGAPVLAGLLQPAEKQNFTKRARAKYFSYALAKELALCDSRLQSSYYRTLTCCSELTQQGNKITAKYCGNRWCLVCNRIRTAKMITKYEPHLAAMCEPHFITLTIPNITGDVKELQYCVTQLQKFCRKAFDRLRKYGIKYKGFRKIEISFNADTQSYHPHVHFISDGFVPGDIDEQQLRLLLQIWKNSKFSLHKFQQLLLQYNSGKITVGFIKAELLRQSWLKEFKHSRPVAQDIRPANTGTLKELFKYSAKIITKRRGKSELLQVQKTYTTRTGETRTVTQKKQVSNCSLEIHVQALDKIYCAIYGKRIIQPVGYTREECAAFNELLEGALNVEAQELTGQEETEFQTFCWRGNDWYSDQTMCRLTGYQPNDLDSIAVNSMIFDSG